jgi:GNAT superfamily N-acetyltransferase
VTALPPPTIPSGGALPWWSQAAQYPLRGEPGIVYFAGEVGGGKPPVDCLLHYAQSGILTGILNHYPVNYPPWEKAGNVNLWVHPRFQRQGIGTALVMAAILRWEFDPAAQRYTPEGHALMTAIGAHR